MTFGMTLVYEGNWLPAFNVHFAKALPLLSIYHLRGSEKELFPYECSF
jgi:hypothetical protein